MRKSCGNLILTFWGGGGEGAWCPIPIISSSSD